MILFLAIILVPFLFGFCGRKIQYNSTNDLTLNAKDFISKVRYIITRDEKKQFHSLINDQERNDFIENFWKKRDPDPATDENEFKDEYYKRIEEANHLFKGDASPGWLTDRGRIYILLGPPDMRRFRPGEINSLGSMKSGYQMPHEIWYYGFYPIIFIDQLENGSFVLTPLSSEHLATILRTSVGLKPMIAKGGKIPLDFNARADFGENGQVNLHVKVPYKNMLFQEDPKNKNRFTTVLTLHTIVFDSHQKKLQELFNDYPLSLTEEELKTRDDFVMDSTLTLAAGEYELQLILESKADDIHTKKSIKVKI